MEYWDIILVPKKFGKFVLGTPSTKILFELKMNWAAKPHNYGQVIITGTKIISNCWKTYNCLRFVGYVHLTVDH